MHEQLHQTARNASFDDGLNLVVGTVREIRDGPAGIDQNLIVERVDKLGKDGKSGGNLSSSSVSRYKSEQLCHETNSSPIRLRGLAPAEVAESPGGIAEHAQLAAVSQEVEQGLEGATAQDVVTACGAIAGNVSKSPDGLLPDIGFRACKKLDKDGDSTGLDNDLSLCGTAGRNVCESPGSLKLDEGVGRPQELDESCNDTRIDNFLNRGIPLL